jgi:hypothetical protein
LNPRTISCTGPIAMGPSFLSVLGGQTRSRMPPPWAATAQPLVSRSARRAVDECASSVICRSLLCSAADHAAGRNGRPRAASHQAQCAASPVSGELFRRRTEPPGPAYSARRQEPKVDPAVLVLAQRTAADPRQLAGLAITVSCAFRNRFQSMRSLVSGTRDGHRGHLDPQGGRLHGATNRASSTSASPSTPTGIWETSASTTTSRPSGW